MIKLRQLPPFLTIGLVLLLSLLPACTPTASSLRIGIHDFKLQNYRNAFVRLKPLAQAGNPEAQYAIGYMYYYGFGVVEDQKIAKIWFHNAATKGQPQAMVALKLLCEKPVIESTPPTTLMKIEPL